MLLVSNLLVLALPIAGITFVRLYDSMLIRQTEAELIVQGAALASVYSRELELVAGEAGFSLGGYGRLASSEPATEGDSRLRPAVPGLDLARNPVLPATPPAEPASGQPADFAAEAGRRLGPMLGEVQRTTLAGLRLVDPEGRVVATSGAEQGLSLAHRPEVAAALDGFDAAVLRRRQLAGPSPPLGSISRGTHLSVVVVFPVRHGDRVRGAVVLERTPMSVRQALYRDRRYFLGGGLLVVIAVVALAWWLAAMLGRPMKRLISATEKVRRGERNPGLPLRRPGTREVDRLSQAVAQMAETLERRAEYIATFAANVSHELKTPLTSIGGTVELLRDHRQEMSPEQLERFLTILEKDAARLDRLVDRLLELARADVLRPGEGRAELRPRLAGLIERFRMEGMHIQASGPALELA
ncbi:MAG: hypothetical protein MI919_28815, partial [Holophagales bacterium]|nr:hypothetical protein [Holophagales bacterium]